MVKSISFGNMKLLVEILYCLVLTSFIKNVAGTKPNIVFILTDDLGYHDVSYHGSPEIPTPNIDALAASGIVLQKYYAAPQCTPSRGQLMTGRYSIRLGLQHHVIDAVAPYGLPLSEKLLPEYLKELGYATHAIGKWHLGYLTKNYTPTYRGFDSFFGYWNAELDYYDYTAYETIEDFPEFKSVNGIDLHDGIEGVKNMTGVYATDAFTQRSVDIIECHDTQKPLFLYVAHLAVHAGNVYQPIQAPYEYIARHDYIKDFDRRGFAGVLSKLDESVGDIFEALHKKDMLDNTIFIFCADNGGDPDGFRGEKSSNWPLRSVKFHLWDGGVRVIGLIWSPLFNLEMNAVFDGLMHTTDWLPTLYRAAGGDVSQLGNIDGVNIWDSLVEHRSTSPRQEILLNIDQTLQTAALIEGKYKLITGRYPDGKDGWYGNSGEIDMDIESIDDWVWKNGSKVKEILEETGRWFYPTKDEWRSNLAVQCGDCHDFSLIPCDLVNDYCLYDLDNDPCEYENIAKRHPHIVESMKKRIEDFDSMSLPSDIPRPDPAGDPRCHGFVYVPWLDDEYKSECPYFKENKND